MYIYSEPFDKEQAIDYILRDPVVSDMTEKMKSMVTKAMMDRPMHKIHKELRQASNMDVVRFAPERLAFRYWIN